MWAAILHSRPARWIAGALAALAAFYGVIARERYNAAESAKNEVHHEYETETARRVEAGRDALRDDPGGAGDDRLHRNDKRW